MAKTNTYKKKFRTERLHDDVCKDWIVQIPTDEKNAYCKYCKTTIRAKLSDIKEHTKIEKSRDLARAEAQLCLFIAKHCSIRSCGHRVDVIKKCFYDKTEIDIAMHRTKCTAVLKNVLMPHFIDKLREDIGDRKYSILLDESTDVSVVNGILISLHSFQLTVLSVTAINGQFKAMSQIYEISDGGMETNHQDNQPTNYGACFSPSNISGSSVYLDQGPYDNYKGMIDEEEICFKIRNIKDNEGEKITNFSRSSSINNEEHAKETISVDSQKCGLKVADFLPETPQNENEFNQSYNTKDSNVSYSTSEMISSTFNKMKKDAEIDKLTNGQQQNSHSSLDKIFATTNRLKNFDKERPISNQLYRTYNDSIRNLELKSNEKESLASFGFMKPGVLQDQSDRNKHLKSRLVPHSLLKNQVNKRNDVFSNTFSKTINDFGNNSRMTRKDQDRKLSHTGNETPNVSHLKKFHDKMEKSYESCSKKKEDFITKKQTEDNKSHVAPDVKRLSPYNHRKIIDLKATSKSDMGFPNSSLLKSNYFQDKARQNNKILGHNENNLHDLNSVPNNYSKNKNLSTISNFESNRDSNVPSRAASIFSTSSSNHDTNFKSILEPLRSNVTSRRQSLSCLNKDNNEHQCIQYNEGEKNTNL
ncbi:unnamed protein product [Lepeophtheirus salmonis]|uniref:(salmon louse) hypothetical protein n=1 Tax=Lepeophtheirus salmonis TaxID=72036 RepID=A0A7R8D2G1_LEPSM|nr:unnamed protein product [Lepeophtheirus salmonis]CAF3005200.1 unnamed protein product [Lepeophtheirus salmonis]